MSDDEPLVEKAPQVDDDDLWGALAVSSDEELVAARPAPARPALKRPPADSGGFEAPPPRLPDKRRKLQRAAEDDEDEQVLAGSAAGFDRKAAMAAERARLSKQQERLAQDRAQQDRRGAAQPDNGLGNFINDEGVSAADADYLGYDGLSTDSEDEGGDRGVVREALSAEHKTGFDEALIRLKPIRLKTKFSDAEMGHFCQDLVVRMDKAHDDDQAKFKAGEIFLEKGALCPDALRCCANARFREPFVLAGGLSCLTRWLTPFIVGDSEEDNRSYDKHILPTVTVRNACYECVEFLMPAITVDALKQSVLAQRVRYYVEHPHETKANRLKCQGFIVRWLQMTVPTKIMVKTDTAEYDVTIPTIDFGKVAKTRMDTEATLKKIAENNTRRHAMIPMKDHLGFKMQPKQPDGVLDVKKKVPLAQLKMQRAVADLVRKANADRAGRSKLGGGHVSIEGRGISVPSRGLPTVRDTSNR